MMATVTSDAAVLHWQKTLALYDGFIFVVAEYNHSITGVLKNAMDSAYRQWNRKPATMIGYSGTGAARAVEHLRLIASALQMVPTAGAIHIAGVDFLAISPMGSDKPMQEIEAHLLASTKATLDEFVWWARATMAARALAQ